MGGDEPDEGHRAGFTDADLSGARFVRCDLSGAVMRAVEVDGADIDAPWLLEGGRSLTVNGVDVVGFLDAELDRRFPGRELRHAADPEGLRAAWAALERTWASTLAGAAELPPGAVDESVDGEWSFSQTLRHLVMATDTWLVGAVLGQAQPYHPIGLPNAEYASDGGDTSLFSAGTPAFEEVLRVRALKVAAVRDVLAAVTAEDLAVERRNPWAPEHRETTASCLRTVLEEEWEHHRYAVRDLAVLAERAGRRGRPTP